MKTIEFLRFRLSLIFCLSASLALIAQSRPKHRWLIAQYPRPAYPAVKSPSRALQSWIPLFEKFNVDLVCEARFSTGMCSPRGHESKV